MYIWRMVMGVAQRRVMVGVAMRMARRRCNIVRMAVLVMLVVGVHVFVRHQLVFVFMAMLFAKQQRDPSGHDCHRCNGVTAWTVAEDRNRSKRAHKRCGRKVGGFACGTDEAQCIRIEYNAHAVAAYTKRHRCNTPGDGGQPFTCNDQPKPID